jgi:hypothetical protein
VEKLCRLAGDMADTRKAAVETVELCFKDASTLNDQIILLSKRRGQLKQVARSSSNCNVAMFLFRKGSIVAYHISVGCFCITV